MKKKRILVTAVGGDLAQSVIKCIKDPGYDAHIVGSDIDPYASGRADVDTFLVAPPVKEEKKYIDFILKIIEIEKIDYVFPMSDVEIMFFNDHRELFLSLPAVIVINEKHVIDTFMDKYKTVQFFKENNIPYPQTWMASEYNCQTGYPVILKKRIGSGSQSLFKVHDAEELQFYLKRLKHPGDMIIQEYLPEGDSDNNEYTAGIFSDGKITHSITFRRKLSPGGYSQKVETVMDSETHILELPRKISEVLKFKGSINVQFRYTKQGGIPFEINPRFSSTVYFRHLFGFKDVQWTLDMYEGKSIPLTLPPVEKGIGVRKLTEEIFK
jgi:carbamoyl-phosphate synthase large subunit